MHKLTSSCYLPLCYSEEKGEQNPRRLNCLMRHLNTYYSDATHQVVYNGAQFCCFLRHVIEDVEETVGCSVVENLFILHHVTDVRSLVNVAENS